MRRMVQQVRNERGATAAFVAVCIAGLLGMGALAVDMGMLLKTHSDAQRTADAAALAGASAFLNKKPEDAIADAYTRAIEYAGRNTVGRTKIDTTGQNVFGKNGNTYVDFAEGQVQVIPAEEKVRVIVTRAAVGTWFGRILGKRMVNVSAKAAAIADNWGTGKCVKPFAFPDYWDDRDDDIDPANRLLDLGPGQGKGGEEWGWDAGAGDTYKRWQDPNSGANQWTGLGSSFRNNSVYKDDSKTGTKYWDDYGRPVVLKKSNPQQTMAPSFFQPWVLPGSSPGAADYRKNIAECSPVSINLNQEYTTDPTADTSSYDNKPGNMIGPTKQGMEDLIAKDPDACWAPLPDPIHSGWTSGEVRKLDASGKCTVAYPEWEASPRVALVPLMDPSLADNGKTKLKFNNLAMIFIEDQKGRHDPVVARFLYFAKGSGPEGPATGPLLKKIRLVE